MAIVFTLDLGLLLGRGASAYRPLKSVVQDAMRRQRDDQDWGGGRTGGREDGDDAIHAPGTIPSVSASREPTERIVDGSGR